MRRILTATAIGLWAVAGLSSPVLAQTKATAQSKVPTKKLTQSQIQTLADIQADIARVKAEVLGLKQEVQPTGTSVAQAPASNSMQSRLDAIDATLQQLTNQTELLQNRINRVVADGTNRIGDLEFRLTEAAGGDISKLGPTKPLGGEAPGVSVGAPPAAAPSTTPASNGPELAVGEQGDFDKAKAAYAAGHFRSAADLFATFAQTYTGGPLTGEALYYQGQALAQMGDTANAARAFLNSFSGYPKGAKAPDALTQLGISLGKLGQTKDACVTLGQVSVRYPNAPAVSEAATAMQGLGCQ
ncbi:MAG: tol-pal system protein YbgF [Paracoccaceae bacterium]|nr:tol-pal system protein YbgF [Paracoccaceae bacterium]